MIDRPLFDSPPAVKPEPRPRSKTPTLPARAKAPPEIWRIELSGHNRDGLPPVVCRIRKVLKNAGRCYHLRAKVIAQPTPIATPGNPTAYQSTASVGGQQTGSNQTGKNEVIAGMTGRMEF